MKIFNKKACLRNKIKSRILSYVMILMLVITNSNITFAETTKQYNLIRLSGQNRYETSFNIAKEFESEFVDNVIVTSGNNFPDALTGSILSKGLNAPILLLNNKVDSSKYSIDYIKDHLKKDGTIYILGGIGVVSNDFVNQFNTLGFKNIIRLGGADRFDTNKKIIDQLAPSKGTPIIIANGYDFADALSVSSIATIKGYPIFISNCKSIPENIKAKISELQPEKVYILGGIGALTDDIKDQVKSLTLLTDADILRIGGENRFETSLNIWNTFKINTDTIVIANGDEFPDALSGSALAAKRNSPIILTNGKDIAKQKEYIDKSNCTNIILLGGTAAIDKSVEDSFNKVVQDNTNPPVDSGSNSGGSISNLPIDSDNDGLTDDQETIYKTDFNNPDTDGDRLTDYQEVTLTGTNPNQKDTDGNGITDDLEDIDKDTINNYNEILLGSNPNLVDTDFDGLTDDKELVCKTNIINPDSDNDNLTDGNEIKYGTDPLNPDSDGNGVKDGEEVFTCNIGINTLEKDEKVEPSIEMSLKGENIGTVSISNVGDSNPYLNKDMPGYIGAPFQFFSQEAFDSAKMTFTVDKTLFNDPNIQPSIYYFNEESKLLELLPDQIVDTSKGTITVDVKHFSTYIVLNRKTIDEVWAKEMKAPPTGEIANVALAIGFSIDSSGSMSWNDPSDLRKQTAKDFVDKLDENDKAAVIDFDYSAKVSCPLTNNKQEIKNAIDMIDNSGGTDLGEGMKATIDELENDEAAVKYVIMLTDGQGSYDDALTQKAKDLGIVVFTIGLGDEVDEILLKQIAEQTGGKYYHAQKASDLSDIFDQTSQETVDLANDEDGDGLSDYHEKKGMRTNTGEWIFTDPNEEDTDGDTLLDGQEVSYVEGYYLMNSNPNKADSDNDGIEDNIDPEPMVYSITDRTLALSAGLSYNNLESSVGNIVGDDKELNDWKIVGANDSGAGYWGDFWDSGLGSVAIKISRSGRRDAVIYALRGTEIDPKGDDLQADILNDGFADLVLATGTDSFQSNNAFNEYKKLIKQYPNADFYLAGHSLGGRLVQDVLYKTYDSNDGVFGLFKNDLKTPIHSATFNGLGYNKKVYFSNWLFKQGNVNEISIRLNNYYNDHDLVGNGFGASLMFQRLGTDIGALTARNESGKILNPERVLGTYYVLSELHGINLFYYDGSLKYPNCKTY